MTIHIHTNNQRRPRLEWADLTDKEKERFDWIDPDDRNYHWFFRYQGEAYDFDEFTNTSDETLTNKGWCHVLGTSVWSAIAINIATDPPFGVKVARIHW